MGVVVDCQFGFQIKSLSEINSKKSNYKVLRSLRYCIKMSCVILYYYDVLLIFRGDGFGTKKGREMVLGF